MPARLAMLLAALLLVASGCDIIEGWARSGYGCNGIDDLNCADFRDPVASMAHLMQCGDEDDLDRDNDGWACERE